ncbi:MAG TPA: TonB-dependent receptor [Albitalea sp.]|nr:TonB-dependent receptor [Albitalea sp.]
MTFTHRAPGRHAAVAVAALAALAGKAHAQGVATDVQLAPVTVAGVAARSGLAADLPSNSASKTADELREQNLFNPEDALKYVPNTSMRKRYIGDRNAMIGGRSFGTLQPSRGLAYVDGYLISNFLGRFDGPRWNMITPEAIARVDVLYGPFSAIYPGNSIGTTVVTTERQPRAFEASARVTGYRQRFGLYGQTSNYDGHQVSAYLGNRLDSGLWYTAAINHQNSTSQPMNYYTVTANAAGQFPAVSGAAVPVTGIQYDIDPKGARRAVFGASAGAIDHTVQDTVKFKVGVSIRPELLASAMLGYWTNRTVNSNRSFLLDAAGRTVWSGRVTDGVNTFNIPASAFAPSNRDELHRHGGFTLKTRHEKGWNGSVVYSNYRILEDVARQADLPQDQADNGGTGSFTRRDGTGWNTFEVQAAYTPFEGDFTGGRHAITMGVHRNGYTLHSPTTSASDWRSTETTLSQRYDGESRVTALYAQDAGRLRDDLVLTLGWREERFSTFDGQQLLRVAACTPSAAVVCVDNGDGSFGKLVPYARRDLSGSSPKASLAWTLPSEWLLKASYGRGVRFPNVEELYNGTVTAASQTLSDPNLAPERSDALELGAEKDWERHHLRVSLFHDDVRDAILRQSDNSVTPSVTRVSNVDRVKTSGIELVWQTQDWLLHGLSIDANAAFARSKVTANARDPQSVGKTWLRVPKMRANLLVAYRPNASWMTSLGVRHSGRAYNDTYNLDVNPDVYGGVSSFTFVDLRASWRFSRQLELAVGVDNAGDSRGYQAHPYPGRTFFTELRATY